MNWIREVDEVAFTVSVTCVHDVASKAESQMQFPLQLPSVPVRLPEPNKTCSSEGWETLFGSNSAWYQKLIVYVAPATVGKSW